MSHRGGRGHKLQDTKMSMDEYNLNILRYLENSNALEENAFLYTLMHYICYWNI